MAFVVLCAAGWLISTQYLDRPPNKESAADLVHGELLAYEVWDDVPYVVFLPRAGAKIILDHLVLDWISIEFPPTPAWQMSGNRRGISATSNPASVGALQHGSTVMLFGQINAPEITTMEIEYDGQRRSFAVSAPGFLVRLRGFESVPANYRWLSGDGSVVWSESARPTIR